ncbi:hypothetical protein ACFO1B_47810 [Dactylosporangium siamense]|nr:hypothetical protein [Dactylosporangium siamense]
MGEVDGGERAALVVGQLAAVWAIGAAGLPVAAGLVFLAAYSGGTGALAVGVLVALAAIGGLLWLTVKGTAAASVLGATTAGQVVWALLVAVAGGVLWGLWWSMSDNPEGMLGKGGAPGLLVNGLPFAAVAGVLLRGWPARLAGTGVVAVAAVLTAVTPTGRPAAPDDLSARLDRARLDRELLYVVSIPGYRPSSDMFGDDLGTGTFMPVDPLAIPGLRWITIIAFDRATAVQQSGGCGEGVPGSVLETAACTTEPDGWVYRRTGVEHGYQVVVGAHLVVVSGTQAVPREVVRGVAGTMRRARPEDGFGAPGQVLFTADVPGYGMYGHDAPPGIMLQSRDPHATPESVRIEVLVDRFDDPCAPATCPEDGDGLRYHEIQDLHGYVIRRGAVNVSVLGGVGVDRAVLRRAALDARPVTEEELLRALPPASK